MKNFYRDPLTLNAKAPRFKGMAAPKTPKKPMTVADQLFKSAPVHVQELHKNSKKLQRAVNRKLWWEEHNKPQSLI